MAYQTIQYLKNRIRKGLLPFEVDFHDWLDSYWHKGEEIPINKVAGLQTELDSLSANQNSGIVLKGKFNSDLEAGLGGVIIGEYYAAGNDHVDGIREGSPVQKIY